MFLFTVAIIVTLPNVTKSDFCLVKDSSYSTYLEIVNCTNFAYCCNKGCCSDAWYIWPLGILVIIFLLCCLTCAKAWWDVYKNRPRNTDNMRVRYRTSDNSDSDNPPSYHIAIYYPQPSNRVPSYEEVMGWDR
ncbi:uncharacterized protein LOC123010202 [Tribolium madens]|uniref:uncharacterized protein LOC123010202 n=1 Tax=Tribolium madens TaxID=41895 RepID=UPI001CF74EE2|nr:uncharacterized protein LOC123010202 [Tribolium madens]